MRASRKMWHENQRAQSLKDRIVDVKEGARPANVKIKVGGGIIRPRLLTKRSSSSSKTAYAVIKTSDSMVELD